MIEIDTTIPKMSAGSGVPPTVRQLEHSLVLSFLVAEDDCSAVLRFVGVRDWNYGYPNDEGLDAHPLYGHRLKFYAFHVSPVASHGERSWTATFHDGTLTVYAEAVEVVAESFLGDPSDAIDATIGIGENRELNELIVLWALPRTSPLSDDTGSRYVYGMFRR